MTREELLKMSKKDLKNRLAELGKNAQRCCCSAPSS